MPARPSWSGYLKFNLISVPLKGYNAAAAEGGKVGFHLLHKGCNERIRYQKVCPIHGEVSNDEIVSAYEVSKGEYVIADKDERKRIRSEDDKTIAVETFIHPEAIDPVFYSGRSYYLLPDGKVAQKPYLVLLETMVKTVRQAVAHVVFAGRAQLAVVHPTRDILTLSLLRYESELKPTVEFADEVQHVTASAEERKMAATLIEAATTEAFDLSSYKDVYTEKLSQMLAEKSQHVRKPGKKERGPAVINLMDALRKSLTSTKNRIPTAAADGRASHRSKKRVGHSRRKTA